MHALQIDIVSDVVCPWCAVGYLRLQQALKTLENQVQATIEWHPFELNPNMPPEGQNLREHIMQKCGTTAEQSHQARQQLQEIGQDLGFQFNFSDSSRIYNTFQAHQLLHWAKSRGKQSQLKLRLFEAYFCEQRDPSQQQVLLEAVNKVGLSAAEAKLVLEQQRYAEQVRSEEYHWLNAQVRAVPCFVFDRHYMVSGAQDNDTLVQVIKRVVQEAQQD